MSYIDLKRFADINIRYHKSTSTNSIRDTVVLFTTMTDTGGSPTLPAFADNRPAKYAPNYDIFASLDEWLEYLTLSSLDVSAGDAKNLDAHIRVFFANGGAKVRIIPNAPTAAADINTLINNLPTEQIVIAHTTPGALTSVATTRATVTGINAKILCDRVTSTATGYDNVPHLAIKYSTKEGCQMTIAAYLSAINIYGNDTVADYDFTVEYGYSKGTTDVDIAEQNDESVLDACYNKNFNVIMPLAGNNKNLGGNTTDGKDITNEYVLIVLHQTLTERIINLLSQKIKGSAGVSKIYAVIDAEMKYYVSNGYLATDKVWTDADYTVSYNGQTYTIISKGESLLSGYKTTILPYSSLTDADKQARKAPPIYIILADAYGIRKVVISGEII